MRLGPVLGHLGDVAELRGMRVVADGLGNAHGLQIVAQNLLLLGRRALVHTEKASVFALLNEIGGTNIGRQHGFFDQLVGIIAGARDNFFNTPRLVADDLCLSGFKIYRTARLARQQQSTVYIVQIEQIGHQGFALHSFGAACVLQDRRNFGVGEACVAEHHSRIKLVCVHLTFGVDQHVANHAKSLNAWVQRTQSIGQFLWQHGNHAAREIHRSGSVVGVDIDRCPRLHIVAHVGNRHQQTPTFATAHLGGLTIHRVVKITRVFAIDGDQRHVAQINAIFVIAGPDMVRQLARLRQRGFGKLVGYAIFADRNFNLHAWVINFTQHLLDTPHRLPIQRRRLGEFDHHHLAGFGLASGCFGDQYILPVALVFRRHQPHATLLQQASDDGGIGAFDDLRHAPFGAALAVCAHDAGFHPVFVQDCPHFVGRQVNIGLSIVANHEAVPIAMT